jgi:hypothetical protein
MPNFKSDWGRYKVAPFKQVSTPLTSNGVFDSSHKGACNTIVMDWFRRIQKGRPTWLAHRDKNSNTVVARTEIPRDKLDKKALRWDNLQNNSNFAEDPRFRTARPGGIEAGFDGGSTVLFSQKVNSGNNLKARGGEAIAAMWVDRSNSTEVNRFYLLSLRADNGFGHSIGLHALPVAPDQTSSTDDLVPDQTSSTDDLVLVNPAPSINSALSIPPNHLHMFDPNHSEWVVHKDSSRRFVGEFLENYYTGFLGPKITSVSVIHIPVWWNG